MSLNQEIQAVIAKAREHAPPGVFETLGGMFARLDTEGVGRGAPKPGEHAPDVSVLTVDGKPVQLATLYAERPIVLIFYRGRWCPFCDLTLRAYDRLLPDFTTAGVVVAAVSPQTVLETTTTGTERGLGYPLFSDPGNTASREFGLVWQVQDGNERHFYRAFGSHVDKANGDETWELPAPAVFVIDPGGVVRWSSVDANWTRRAEPEDVLTAVRGL